MKYFKIYCAGFDVFDSKAKEIAEYQRSTCKNIGFEALTPMDNESNDAQEIFNKNLQMIKDCDFVIANLNNFRDNDMDSGTAFEIGYAYSLNKPVFGYMDDTRNLIVKNNEKVVTIVGNKIYKVEDFNLPVNLMIGKSCTEIIEGSFIDCLVNCVLPYVHAKDVIKEVEAKKTFRTVRMTYENNFIIGNIENSIIYPDLYEEVSAHDERSVTIWYSLSEKAYEQYEKFMETHSLAFGGSNNCKKQ